MDVKNVHIGEQWKGVSIYGWTVWCIIPHEKGTKGLAAVVIENGRFGGKTSVYDAEERHRLSSVDKLAEGTSIQWECLSEVTA